LLKVISFGGRQSTVGVTGHRDGGDVRGCLLAVIMILDYGYKDAYISAICKTPMHVRSSGQQHAL
jgi:hypothetical protein